MENRYLNVRFLFALFYVNCTADRVCPFRAAAVTGGAGDGGSHTLLIVPSYFDYLRLRNYLCDEAGIQFAACCEYDRGSQVSRARGLFFQGRASVLLITERFHFFKRCGRTGGCNVSILGVFSSSGINIGVFCSLSSHFDFQLSLRCSSLIVSALWSEQISHSRCASLHLLRAARE